LSDKKTSVFPLLLVNFISTLGFSIVIPFLIFLVTKFGGNALVYGVIGAVYPAFQLIGAPILGKWSDIFGRKKILVLSGLGTFIGWIIFFISFFLPQKVILDVNIFLAGQLLITLPVLILFIARAVDGLTGGNISVANAYLADITEEKDRNKNFGKLSISFNLGFIVGPALAGILGSTSYGEMLPVIAAALLSLVAMFAIFFFLPESKPQTFRGNPKDTGVNKILGIENKECFEKKGNDNENVSLKKILTVKFIPYFLFLNFLIFLGFNFFYTAFPVHAVQKLGWSISQMGIFFSVLGLVMVFVQGPILNYASKKFSEKALILIGSFVLGTNFILLLSENIGILYIAAVLFAFGNGLMWPSFLSLLSKTASSKYQGTVQGYASSAGSLASIIGLIAGGLLYESLGAFTFLISALVIYVVFVLSFRIPTSENFKSSM